ncbi:MAG TPA: hypothetical protein HA349_08320 [Methanotrichaceae archaeon]|nr:hypothetical protein [Methanotrichaceae archaeon]
MYRVDLEKKYLFFEGQKFEPRSVEGNFVGFCSLCEGELWSFAYYQVAEGWMVAARCDKCDKMVLARYDSSWSWKGDFDLEAAEPARSTTEHPKTSSILDLPREQLEVVFTPAELRDMERCKRGEPYTRQNLYRARAKYEKFERLFGVRIDL